jgi:hypothetical protein
MGVVTLPLLLLLACQTCLLPRLLVSQVLLQLLVSQA